jgi:hypothetical protein
MGIDVQEVSIEGGQDVRVLLLVFLGVAYFEAEQVGSEGVVPLDMLGRNLQFVISSLAGEDLFII